MFKSLKEKIRPSQFAEKLGHISKIEKSDNREFAVILRSSDVERAKKYLLAACGNNKPKAVFYLKSGKIKKNFHISLSGEEIAEELSGNCTLEKFKTNRELFSLLKGKNFRRIYIFYAENIDRPNLFFEIASFRRKSAEIFGIESNNDCYQLPKKFFRYKVFYTIFKDILAGSIMIILRVAVFALLFIILAPFVTIFWAIILLLMIFK